MGVDIERGADIKRRNKVEGYGDDSANKS